MSTVSSISSLGVYSIHYGDYNLIRWLLTLQTISVAPRSGHPSFTHTYMAVHTDGSASVQNGGLTSWWLGSKRAK
jgi:hypothetical protein